MSRLLPRKFSASKSKRITPSFLNYKNITLKLFLEIAETSDYKKLLISGEASAEDCAEQFEKIVEQHNYHNGNHDHLNYLSHLKSYRDLLLKFNTVRECILCLTRAIDEDIITWLASQGYPIDTSCQSKFEKTFAAALNKSNNINSKLKQKWNQIQNFNQVLMERQQAYNGAAGGIEERLATLSFNLGFSVDETITLARYNEYVKIINKQNGSGKK